jgi:Flp pilus assembly protein TadB
MPPRAPGYPCGTGEEGATTMTGSPRSGASAAAPGAPRGRRDHHRIRSGDEPVHARSPLRLRLGLALVGLANGVAGVIVFALLHSAPLTGLFLVVCAVALINVAVVVHRIRQGPHYQPGPGVPPYRPVESDQRPTPRTPATARVRRRRYVIVMGACVLLITLAWTWIRLYSLTAALVMSAVAALMPPLAAVVTNVDSPIFRDEDTPADPRPPVRPPDRG